VTLSNTEITYVIAAACLLAGTAAYVGWILVPAWKSYSRLWERFAASFLTLYVAAAFCGIGIIGGAAVTYFWDQIGV
jgi:hypothetical protein